MPRLVAPTIRPCDADLLHLSSGYANDFLEGIHTATATRGWRSGTCGPKRLANRLDYSLLPGPNGELIQQPLSASAMVLK